MLRLLLNFFAMKRIFLSLLSFAALAVGAQTLLPKPQSLQATSNKSFTLHADVRVVVEPGAPPATVLLQEALQTEHAKGGVGVCVVRPYPDAPNAEAYKLRITPDSLIIFAHSEGGVTCAAATLLQLRTEKGKLPCVEVSDAPAYAWRGIMLDVSRHFFPLSHLKRQIDILARHKMNTLHLHLTDAAGWRMEIKRYPRLTGKAAWRTKASWKEWWNGDRGYRCEGDSAAYGGYYTQAELRDLVAYARARNINIVPEIEMPGHSEEVLAAYPELSCTHDPKGAADFCPGNVGTYDFLENILLEVMEVFPSQYIHVGGDEAGKAAWNDCPLCQQKAKELGLDHVNALQGHLIRHMNTFLARHGRTLVGWDEVMADTLEPGTHIMNWRSTELAREAAARNLKVILTPGAYCYLDYYQDAPPFQPEAIGGYLPLDQVYRFVSMEELNTEERKAVCGVQGNLWAEYIPTVAHAEYMLYPRALALAEIGWNGESREAFPDFRKRAVAVCDLLRSEGTNTFDLHTEIGLRKEYLTPISHKALGATVVYNLPFSPYYPAAGASTLTDGLRGGWTHSDQRWQGFIGGKRFDVTIDLEEVQTVRSVATGFMHAPGAEIYVPSAYILLTSEDGKNFTEVARQTFDGTDETTCQTYTWKGKISARYLRIQAPPAAKGGWVFADEVVVK